MASSITYLTWEEGGREGGREREGRERERERERVLNEPKMLKCHIHTCTTKEDVRCIMYVVHYVCVSKWCVCVSEYT